MKCACDGHLYRKEMGAGSSIAVVAALATVSMFLQHYLSIYLCIYEYSYEPHVITTAYYDYYQWVILSSWRQLLILTT